MTCGSCGATAPDGARFCASCGRSLRTVDDERRVVTVLFADLVGFTTLSERLDPERVKNLVDRCFDCLARDVTSFGGQVDKIVGDAMVALFGVPAAHEDDAERAVRAALRMQATLQAEAAAIGQDLRMRIGVNTGEVLVGAMRAAGSVTAMGDVVNTASRLQTGAQPGEVLVGPATHAATQHTIAYEPRGLVAAKGRDEPIDTWVAVAPTLPPGSRVRRVDVPLVGRDDEVRLLRHAVDTSMRHQRALLALVVGDVGMGKSRLGDEVAAWSVETHGSVVREGRCVPYGEANVWWPVAEALRDGLALPEGEEHGAARKQVRGQLATAMQRRDTDPEVQRTAEGLLTLMGYDPPPELDPTSAREEAGRALSTYVSASASIRPVVLQLSDLHWADDAVLDLVDDVFATIHHCPVVLLASARPALLDRWTARPGRHNSLVLHLDPLERDAAAELLGVLVGAEVPAGVTEALLDRSGGNPFYLEELAGLLDGSGADAVRVAALPDTLRGLVAARLDDLAPDLRSVLQDASVIGQRGPMDGLRDMVTQLGRPIDFDATMAELVADELMEIDGLGWRFRTDLVRQVAYQTITKGDRAKTHLGIARYLERAAAKTPRPPWVVDQLAHHYGAAVALAAELGPSARTEAFPADLADQARRWVTEAADRARRDQALPTALRLYGQALALLEPATGDGGESEVAPSPDVDHQRATEAARLHLARAEVAVEGWNLLIARREVEAAAAVAATIGDQAMAARALVVRGAVEQHEGEVDAAIATLSLAAERFADLEDLGGLGTALRQRALAEVLDGRVEEATVSAKEALGAFELAGDVAGQGWALQNLAWTAFVTGRVDEADARLQEAIDRFSELMDTRGLAWSLGLLAWVRFQQRRVAEATALGEQVLEEAEARNDPWATAMMRLLLSLVSMWSGRTSDAVDTAERTLRAFRTIGDPYGEGQASATLGRALIMAGRVDEGFDLLVEAGTVDGVSTGRGPAGGQFSRVTRLAAAIQVGEPDRAADVVAEVAGLDGIAVDDLSVMLGLEALQRGDLDGAASQLDLSREDSDDGNLASARAMLAAASGSGDAGAFADSVAAMPAATYLDLAVAELAGALEAARHGRADGSDAASTAGRRVAAARAATDATGDRVAQAVVALGAARVAAGLGADDRDDLHAVAQQKLADLGITAEGWSAVFDLALDPAPQPEPV